MAEIASSGERIRDGEGALARGEWGEARAIFERELEVRETVEALEGLSWAAWWVEDVPTCVEARERAYRISRRQGDVRRAAMLAVWLGDDYLVLRGERAIANGWFQRAARLLDGIETCPEHGWLDALVGYMALVQGDTARARELAAEARALGRSVGVVALEMFALCVEGVALVNGSSPGRHVLPGRGHRGGAGGRVRADRAGGVDLLHAAQRVRTGAGLRARRRVVPEG
jgi:LuxR family maltose regulon positive regulatory protein